MVCAIYCVCALGAGVVRAPQAQAQAAEVQPPRVLTRQDAVYPPDAAAAGLQGDVILKVLVTERGDVGTVEVLTSAGVLLDAAAIEAVKQWQFTPATRDGVAMASHIRVPFRFSAPEISGATTKASPDSEEIQKIQVKKTSRAVAAGLVAARVRLDDIANQTANADDPAEEDEDAGALDVSVEGFKKPPPKASSDFVLDSYALSVAPQGGAAELMGRAPGVYVSRPEGEAVAHEIYLRGFDAAHGQDVEIKVSDIPINQPSHIHGQGYADLNFVVPEVVRSLRVTEGIYSPTQGDFAVAGSVAFDLGVERRGYQLKTAFGSFGTIRQVVVWAPEGEDPETFGAGQIRNTQGFGQNRGGLSGGGIGQYVVSLGPTTRMRWHAAAHGARAAMAGVLRREDVENGSVGFYESYADTSATSQSASSLRAQLGVTLERTAHDGSRSGFSLWAQDSTFRSRTNFTGYVQRSQQRPEWVGTRRFN